MYLRVNKDNEEELYKKYTDSAWNYAKNCLEYEHKYKNYTNIFIRLKKNELDFDILGNLIICLKEIEDSKIDQHEASVKVGKILKKLFIDSAMKREKKMEKKLKKEEKKFVKPKINISWADYKKTL